jgi:hypothetical protein
MRLTREVIAPEGPSRREAVRDYRQLRLAYEKVQDLITYLRDQAERAKDVDPLSVVDELEPLMRRVRELL